MTRDMDWAKWHRVSQNHFARVASHYDGGRTFEQGEFWAAEIAQSVALANTDWLLEVGCGTGLLTHALAAALRCQVIGLDPSLAMLDEARTKSNGQAGEQVSDVRWVQGCGERLCFRENTFQAIFLSQVWHHLADSVCAAREFYRALRPSGGLFVKTFSHAQLRERWDLTNVFPELLPFMLNIYPDISDFYALLTRLGYVEIRHKCYRKDAMLRPSAFLKVAEEKLWSMFAYIDEQAYQRGIGYLRELIASTQDAPIPSPEVHLLVSARK